MVDSWLLNFIGADLSAGLAAGWIPGTRKPSTLRWTSRKRDRASRVIHALELWMNPSFNPDEERPNISTFNGSLDL